jgi:hypothetical protein
MTSIKLKRLNKCLLFFLVFSSISCKGQIRIPDDYIETEPPKLYSKEWLSVGNSLHDFGVKIVNGELLINPISEAQIHDLRIKGGLLQGMNHGEFGGELIYIPDGKPKKSIKIKDGNVKFLYSLNNKIYFIEGLAHLSIDEGALFEIDTTSHPFSYKQIIDFGSSPEAFAIFQNELLIVTNKYFVIVHDNKKEIIFKDLFWDGLYPNSIAVLNRENVFVGIRGGFVKIDLINKSFKFYKYNK